MDIQRFIETPENSQEYYAHFHLLTLLITTISPNSSPEISQCLLSYILSDRAVPVYVSVKAHLALVKATSLENLVVILNNIRQSSPSAAVGISRAILEEQNINLDEDNELQTKSFEVCFVFVGLTTLIQLLGQRSSRPLKHRITQPHLQSRPQCHQIYHTSIRGAFTLSKRPKRFHLQHCD